MSPTSQTILGGSFLAAIFGSVYVWSYVIRRFRAGEELIPFEPRRAVPWSWIDLLLTVMGYVLAGAVVGLVLSEYFGLVQPIALAELDSSMLIRVQMLSAGLTLGVVLFAAILVVLRTKADTDDLGLSLRHFQSDIKLGAIAFVAIAPPVYALQAMLFMLFPQQHPLIDTLREMPGNEMFLMIGFSVMIVAPLSEEFLFRVLLQGWLEAAMPTILDPDVVVNPDSHNRERHGFGPRRDVPLDDDASAPTTSSQPSPSAQSTTRDTTATISDDSATNNPYAASQSHTLQPRLTAALFDSPDQAWAVVLSAFLFAAMHLGQGPAPIPLFFLALVLGYLYQRTHRIWAPLVVHFLLNTSTLAMLWLNLRG